MDSDGRYEAPPWHHAYAWCFSLLIQCWRLSIVLLIVKCKISAALSELWGPRGVVKHFHLPGWLVSLFVLWFAFLFGLSSKPLDYSPTTLSSLSNLIQGLSKFYSVSRYLHNVLVSPHRPNKTDFSSKVAHSNHD